MADNYMIAKEAKIFIKVIVDKVNMRVVYAEADHSFVDILFSFMTLPMGTIARLLRKYEDTKLEALLCFNNLYQSLKDLPEYYLATEECKFMLLNPRSLSFDYCRNLKLKIDDTEPTEYFICHNCNRTLLSERLFFSIYNKAKCRRCTWFLMNIPCSPSTCTKNSVGRSVFVSDAATFLVTDDFSVMPYTASSSIRVLTDLGIKDMSHLEERKLDIGREQMLFLLKMALEFDFPLTAFVFRMFYYKNNVVRSLNCPSQRTCFHNHCKLIKNETSTSPKMLMEVSLQKSTGKLLLAETNEDFVEFLFCFLSLPLGTVIGTLLEGASSIRCMDNLFKSLSDMSVGRYIKSQDIKDMLLKPHFGQQYTSKNKLFPFKGTTNTIPYNGFIYRLKDPRIEERYIKQSGTFFVSDDLVIVPSSSCSTMDILKKFKVQFDDIERYEISIGLEEGLRIMKASLQSKLTLTSIIKHQLKK